MRGRMAAVRDGLAAAMRSAAVVLDGGLSTELERAGHDVSSRLWSARLLRDDPEAIVAAHRAFVAAGARVATTASYQASFEGFAAAGIDRAEAARLLTLSVALARRATDGLDAWVAASIGPFGATLADGSEYTGAYADALGVAGLRTFHRPRLEILVDAEPDVLACETLPSAVEVEALLAELDGLPVPAWISLTTVEDADGVVRTRTGERAADAFALVRGIDNVVAVGVNCLDPAQAGRAVEVAVAASGKPAIVYPNSGEHWDAAGRRWRGSAVPERALAPAWVAAGARLVGGCCRVRPSHIAALTASLDASV